MSEKARIAKFTLEDGVVRAARKFQINESSVRNFKKTYIEERSRIRAAGDYSTIETLPSQKRGRPLIVGERVDAAIQEYVLEVRRNNGSVNTAVVCAGARGLLKSMDATMLAECGGPVTLGRGWAMSLLKRMNFTRRMGTTRAKVSPEHFEELRIQFLQEIVDMVEIEKIPPRHIFN